MELEFRILIDSKDMIKPLYDNFLEITERDDISYEEFENLILYNKIYYDKIKKLGMAYLNTGLDGLHEDSDVYKLADELVEANLI
jgi:hypothetical protein